MVQAIGADAAQEFVAAVNTSTGSGPISAGSDATHLGFFSVTAVAQASAYTLTYSTKLRTNSSLTAVTVSTTAFTQTYATATHTHSNPTAVALTNSTGGTPATTFAAIVAPGANATTSLTADMTAVQNALAQTAVSINALIVDVANVKSVANSIITDLGTNQTAVNALIVDVLNIKKVLTALVFDLQAYGLLQ